VTCDGLRGRAQTAVVPSLTPHPGPGLELATAHCVDSDRRAGGNPIFMFRWVLGIAPPYKRGRPDNLEPACSGGRRFHHTKVLEYGNKSLDLNGGYCWQKKNEQVDRGHFLIIRPQRGHGEGRRGFRRTKSGNTPTHTPAPTDTPAPYHRARHRRAHRGRVGGGQEHGGQGSGTGFYGGNDLQRGGAVPLGARCCWR